MRSGKIVYTIIQKDFLKNKIYHLTDSREDDILCLQWGTGQREKGVVRMDALRRMFIVSSFSLFVLVALFVFSMVSHYDSMFVIKGYIVLSMVSLMVVSIHQ